MREEYTIGANADSRHIREVVFIEEQGFREEFDDIDDYALTLVIYDDANSPIATGRLYEVEPHVFKLGRIAVLKEHRMEHLGSRVIASMERKARSLGATETLISAQTRAVPFYEKCGYLSFGDTYYEEHVEHIMMKKSI